MIFSSYSFIFVFLPITLAGYYLCRRFMSLPASKVFLIAASLVFYGFGDYRFVPVLVFTAVLSYFAGQGVRRCKNRCGRRLFFLLGLFENLGILFYFKYTNFFIENINAVLGSSYSLVNVILPLGISFYTFQIITYLVNTMRGETEDGGFVNFMVFVTFFPQLIVGPVMQHEDMLPQLGEESFGCPDSRAVIQGIVLFSIGCAKKILLADTLIGHAQNFYNVMGNGNFFEAWGAVASYTFAYYFDFSGYIDMALGLGLFFNVRLPQNFNSPYKASNFAEYWRRWNMTISRFFNDNVFRNIFHFGDGVPKLILATLVTFVASGVWHGAGWHFIFWGLANGVLVCIANLMDLKDKHLPGWLSRPLTFLFIMLTRVLFDANGTTQAVSVYQTMFGILPAIRVEGGFLAMGASYVLENIEVIALLLLSAVICFCFKNSNEIAENLQPRWYHAAGAGLLLAASFFSMGEVSQFLYFQF